MPIDIITLRDSLGPEQEEKIGGPIYLARLTDGLPRAYNCDYYAELIKQRSRERHLLQAIQNTQTAYLSGNGHVEIALQDLKNAIDEAEIPLGEKEFSSWKTVRCDDVEDWKGIAPVQWCCDQMIPRNSIGFIGGGPKDGKSVLLLDLMIKMAHAQHCALGEIKFLDKFIVHGQRVLYVSKEDGMERLFQRWPDINQSYGFVDPPPDLVIVPRKCSALTLTEPKHMKWLEEQINRNESTFLCLDVFSELIPGLDEMREIRQALTILKDLRDRLNITIAVIDHTRKPVAQNAGKFKNQNQDLDPTEIRGAFKFGASDWTIMLAVGCDSNTLKISIRCKDSADSSQAFIIKRSPIGSTEPKHRIIAEIQTIAERAKEKSQETADTIMTGFPYEGWHSLSELEGLYPELNRRRLQRQLSTMVDSHVIERAGSGRHCRYRRADNSLP